MVEKQSRIKKDSEISHQDIIRYFDKKTEETKRYFDVVAEDLTSKIQVVAELASSIPDIKEMVGKNSEDIEVMKIDIEVMKTDMGAMKMDIQLIKQNLKRKVDIEEFEMLEKRVIALESKSR